MNTATRRCKARTSTLSHCTSPWIIYITFSTAVACRGHTVLLFVLADKVSPRVADGRSGAAGAGWVGAVGVSREERGKRRQREGRPSVTKAFGGLRAGVRGRGSICCGLRGHCSAWERPVAVVCAALAFFFKRVGGSLSGPGPAGQTKGIHYSWRGTTHEKLTQGSHNICFFGLPSGNFCLSID